MLCPNDMNQTLDYHKFKINPFLEQSFNCPSSMTHDRINGEI